MLYIDVSVRPSDRPLLQMRRSGQEMAAFIHHYTRFRAHGESVKMETRMKAETVRRIARGLQATKQVPPCRPSPKPSPNPCCIEGHALAAGPPAHSRGRGGILGPN